jgi:hypothetical protein
VEGLVDDPGIIRVDIFVVDNEIDWVDWEWMVSFLVWDRPCTMCEFVSCDI